MPTITEVQGRLHVVLAEPLVSVLENRSAVRDVAREEFSDLEAFNLMPVQQRGIKFCRLALAYVRSHPGSHDGYTPGAFALDLISRLCASKSRRESARRGWGMAYALPPSEVCRVTQGTFLAQAIGFLFTNSELFRQATKLSICAAQGTARLEFTDNRETTFQGPAFDPQRTVRDIRSVEVQTLKPIADIFGG